MFSATDSAARYQPRPQDAPAELFERRLEICAECPFRNDQQCTAASPTQPLKLITLAARSRAAKCPTGQWPGDTPPARPIPVWNHDRTEITADLGPHPAAASLDLPELNPSNLTRNLLCHIYPQTAGQKWRRTARRLCARHRRGLFNGRKIIAVSTDHESDPIEEVKTAFAPLEAEFIETENDCDLGECRTFQRLLERVAYPRAQELTFYCHGKGASWPESHHPAHEWADALFAVHLDFPETVTALLEAAPFCGAFRRRTSLGQTRADWHYSGSFYWFRNDFVFAADRWKYIEQQWAGTEAWPSLQADLDYSACLFLDNAGDLYDPAYWDSTVRAALRAWKNARWFERAEVTPMTNLLDQLTAAAHAAGSDHLPTFGGIYEGGYALQQVPEELSRLVCLLSAYAPFESSLEIGIASGGTTRFIREQVSIFQTAIIDDGRHPRFPEWEPNRQALEFPVAQFIGDSHSPEAAAWLEKLDRRFDLVAIDGDHSAAGVRADWDLVKPLLADRAIVWFHDVCCPACPGVIALWQELRCQHHVLLETNDLGVGVLQFRI